MSSPVSQPHSFQLPFELLPGDPDVKKVILEDMAGNDYRTAFEIASAKTINVGVRVPKSFFHGNDQSGAGIIKDVFVLVPDDLRFTAMCLKKIVALKLPKDPTSLKLFFGYHRIDNIPDPLFGPSGISRTARLIFDVVALKPGENQVEGTGVKKPEIQPKSDSCVCQ